MERTDMMHKMYDMKGPIVAERFRKRGFGAYYCPTKEEALQRAITLIPNGHVVSWGGTASCDEIGLKEYVLAHYTCINRDDAQTPEERAELMRKALLCDTFLMGTNAATEDGELYNIDGNGNRVAALIYGPRQVLVIVGMNKVVPTLADAITRARTIAAPINMQRFQNHTPCGLTGMCGDCLSADSICNQFIRTRRCQPKERIKVILVGENLGY